MPYPARPLADRFWPKVRKSDGCWEWTRATTTHGYGKFSVATAVWDRAHRVAWKLTNGPIPDGMFVCHHCDNPLCVRPDHLFLGTHGDNMRDASTKGRMPGWNAARTHCKHGHAFTHENTLVSRGKRGNPARSCRTCNRTNGRERYRRLARAAAA